MYVKRISCKDFRNFSSIKVELCSGVNILYGDNAEGKTSFLEAVYMCATGRSQRAGTDRELISFGEKEAHVQAYVYACDNIFDKIDIHLKKDGKKGIAINNLSIKTLGELFGVLLVVIFSPEDLQLIKLGPAERRRFMDMELCQLSNIYYYELGQYYRILKQRNNLLKSIQKNPALRDTVFAWDEQMAEHGCKIIEFRKEFIDRVNQIAKDIHSSITNNTEELEIIYKPNVSRKDFFDKLTKNLDKDVLLGSTFYGIHKDDLIFNINNVDSRVFGSQGQQRTAALSAKLAEIEIVREQKNSLPVLLLDDVLSELDKNRQKFLVDRIGAVQTIITCTGTEVLIDNLKGSDNIKIFKVHDKRIEES